MEFEPMLTPREKSPLPENVPRGVSNPRHFGSEPKHYQLSYSGPIMMVMTLNGAILAALKSTHCAANCPQHAHAQSNGAVYK